MGQTVIARLMETQIFVGSVGGGFRKGKMAFASTSVWEKASPPALTLMPGDLDLPCTSLDPFQLLSQCWSSEQVNPSDPENTDTENSMVVIREKRGGQR